MANSNHSSNERLFAAVREAQDSSLRLSDSGEHARAKARLLQAVDEVDRKQRAVAMPQTQAGRSPWTFGLGTLAAAACAFAVMFAWPDSDALELQLDGQTYAANQMIVAGEEPRLLAFSDDTRIELSAGSRMKVSDLRDNGASVSLVEGSIALAVHHEADTSWQVEAGPWTVHVTGTQFEVEWQPSAEYFSVAVSEGSVRVEGPDGELAKLRAGESMVRERGKARIEPETLQIASARDSSSDDAEGEVELERDTAAPEPMVEAEEAGELEPAPAPKPRAPKLSWVDHYDNSDFERAWDVLAAQPKGIYGAAEGASSSTLLDLADVARFTKHTGDARRLLQRLRDEHPGTTDAAEAAFSLGRLEASTGNRAEAAAHFERYLDERPAGSHAQDALGRLMDCYEALGDSAQARSSAQKYLAGFPKGPHADKAESILGQ